MTSAEDHADRREAYRIDTLVLDVIASNPEEKEEARILYMKFMTHKETEKMSYYMHYTHLPHGW